MDILKGKLIASGVILLSLPLTSALAAQSVDLSQQKAAIMLPSMTGSALQVHETSRVAGNNQMLHIRVQQTFAGYDVWGADGVVHIKHGAGATKTLTGAVSSASAQDVFMNGTMYRGLDADLASAPKTVFSADQANKALQLGMSNHEHTVGGSTQISAQQSKLIVFVDANHKAHWAYHVSFDAAAVREGALPAKPNFLIDAITLQVYQQWDNLQTTAGKTVDAGGFGGNIKMGKLIYDGLDKHLAKLSVTRDGTTCSLITKDVNVKSAKTYKTETFSCKRPNDKHNGVYWDAPQHPVNDGYSPDNDALFGGMVIKNMYKQWYNLEALAHKDGTPMVLTMVVHDPIGDNAYWNGTQMAFGDGKYTFYPLTSLGVAAHEISHGFTEQHADLKYYNQSGGMNEAFSDMAAQAAEIFAYGKNSWEIGPEIFKEKDRALRYLIQPSKDCRGKKPGTSCSIDDASQYYSGLNVHYSSGVFNRLFYLIASAPNMTVRKAFDIMVTANTNYWTATSTFEQGACGVLNAAIELKYDTDAVKKAIEGVKIDHSRCMLIIN